VRYTELAPTRFKGLLARLMAECRVDLTGVTKYFLLVFACALMAALIVLAALFSVPGHFQVWSDSSASDGQSKMQKDELIIQLLKIGLGLVFAAYFLWWSLEVLSRLSPN
jgi:hypothetical protein